MVIKKIFLEAFMLDLCTGWSFLLFICYCIINYYLCHFNILGYIRICEYKNYIIFVRPELPKELFRVSNRPNFLLSKMHEDVDNTVAARILIR